VVVARRFTAGLAAGARLGRIFEQASVVASPSYRPLDPERRALLLRAKLTALVRAGWGVGTFDPDPRPAGGGAALKAGEQGWMLVEEDPGRALGRGLLWARRAGVHELHLLFSSDGDEATRAARRGRHFRTSVQAWQVHGTSLAEVAVEPLPSEPPLDPRAEPYRVLLRDGGADPVVEWGTLFGDVWGLEVARAQAEDGDLWLGVGVTKEDRLTHRLVWGDDPGVDAVRSVVDQARQAREHGDLAHPLNQLARERWLRAWLVEDPGQVGATALQPVSPPVPRPEDVRARAPAPALGSAPDGSALLAVCSVGLDTEAVPIAVELREAAASRAGRPVRLVLVVPAGDDHPLLRLVREDAAEPFDVVHVPDDWPVRSRRARSPGVG
jgi:hypothetical protein